MLKIIQLYFTSGDYDIGYETHLSVLSKHDSGRMYYLHCTFEPLYYGHQGDRNKCPYYGGIRFREVGFIWTSFPQGPGELSVIERCIIEESVRRGCTVCALFFLFVRADSQPSFTVIPNNGNPIYVTEGASSLTLAWDYNADGRTVKEVFLVYVNGANAVVVAGKAPSGSLQMNLRSGYNGRVTFRGRATFTISSIVPSDSRIYNCRVTFTTFNPPEISSSNVEVVVVGEY